MHSHLRAALALLLTLTAAHAGDWARFRGPNGTGIAPDRDVPVKWTATDGVLWKTAIPGVGNSSPIVCGGRVFVQTAAADGAERRLLCLDAGKGTILWSKAAPGKSAKIHPRNTLASGTPAADGERVYVAFWDGKDLSLVAFDFAGELIWQRDLGPFVSQHGAGHSPIVDDGRVFFANDQDGAAELFAFDAKTGKTLWQHARKAFRACYSTPFFHGDELIVGSTAGVTSYDPTTGSEKWHYAWSFTKKPLRTVASPVVANDLVLANAGDGDGSRHLIAVRLGGKGDVSRTNLVWEETRSFPYVPCLLARGDHVYSVSDAGIAACHVARTGEKVWSERLGSPMSASPITIDGNVYAAGEDGQVFVFAAAPKFALLAKNTIGEPIMATPAVADGRLYLRGKEHLFCIGKAPAR